MAVNLKEDFCTFDFCLSANLYRIIIYLFARYLAYIIYTLFSFQYVISLLHLPFKGFD